LKSFLEQLGNQLGITTKELFSGKYGNSYDEILQRLIDLTNEVKTK
jgi:hypothetical protein